MCGLVTRLVRPYIRERLRKSRGRAAAGKRRFTGDGRPAPVNRPSRGYPAERTAIAEPIGLTAVPPVVWTVASLTPVAALEDSAA